MMPTEFTVTEDLYVYLIFSIWLVVFVSLALGYSLGRRRKNRIENQGEAKVRKILTEYCKQSTAHVLNNVTLPYGDGTTQIDHILITQNGILVIETKHYKGWLFAHEKQKQWTQVIYQFRSKFQNPIFQNAKHVSATRQLLDFLDREEIQSLVVFTGDAKFKTEVPPGVIHANELLSYVDTFKFSPLSENRVQFCVGRLECKRLELTRETDVEHQAYLEKKFGETDG